MLLDLFDLLIQNVVETHYSLRGLLNLFVFHPLLGDSEPPFAREPAFITKLLGVSQRALSIVFTCACQNSRIDPNRPSAAAQRGNPQIRGSERSDANSRSVLKSSHNPALRRTDHSP
jgi:hypothetical protein